MNRMVNGSLVEIMHALASEGVKHFPKPQLPSQEFLPNQMPEPQKTVQNAPETTPPLTNLLTNLSECSACALSQSRSRVVAPRHFLPQKIMVISDFPDPADELAPAEDLLFTAPKSPHQVLQRMFNYLGISHSIHRSFAVKCTAPRGIPNTSLAACAQNLTAEITAVDPEVIVCAGLRSARAVLSKTAWNFSETPELGEVGPVLVEGRLRRVLIIPAAAELEANEKWRGPVGAFLKQALAQV